jgi:NAD(P)-dependent dehydrogenase (short-subunit alcohol dehydrogenase family)
MTAIDSKDPDTKSDLSGRTTIVVGASRGIGRGIAIAFAEAGGPVVAVSRSATTFPHTPDGVGGIESKVADAADATMPGRLLDRYDPGVVILVAGATPYMRPLQHQTWETFSINWQADVRMAFHWLRESLLKPLRPGSRVMVFSSGAALHANGSPLSGGYAGAKATQRFITWYAQDEAKRAGLDITYTVVLPRFAPQTGVGRPAVKAYADRAGKPVEEYLGQMDYPLLTPETAGSAIVGLTRMAVEDLAAAYVLDGAGLHRVP